VKPNDPSAHVGYGCLIAVVTRCRSTLTDDDGNLGWSSGIWMNGCIQLLEVLGLVLQINNFLLEVELFLDQSDPCSLCKGAPAGRQAGRRLRSAVSCSIGSGVQGKLVKQLQRGGT